MLTWLQSESCHFKIFVGTRVAEIQELTSPHALRYVNSMRNSADDINRGKALQDLVKPNRWSQGPPFLLQPSEEWPVKPNVKPVDDVSEYRKSIFCGVTSSTSSTADTEVKQYGTWKELLEATVQEWQGAARQTSSCTAEDYRKAGIFILQKVQHDGFLEELQLLKAGKPVSSSSRLPPEIDEEEGLIRVGGRLRHAVDLEQTTVHPIMLDPGHPYTRLLIQDFDDRLHHPGPERLFAEIRRLYWILQGREAVHPMPGSKCNLNP